jgi:hypothetical protein
MGFSSQGRAKGSTFFFELPLHSSAAAGIEPNNLDQVQPLPKISSPKNFFNSRYSPSNRLKLLTPPSTSHSDTTSNTTIIESSKKIEFGNLLSGRLSTDSVHNFDGSHVVDFDEEEAFVNFKPEASSDAINEPCLLRVSAKNRDSANEVERGKAFGVVIRMDSYLIAINNFLYRISGSSRSAKIHPDTMHAPPSLAADVSTTFSMSVLLTPKRLRILVVVCSIAIIFLLRSS